MNTNIIEMTQLSGTVAYSYSGMDEQNPKPHLEKFHILSELMNLLQENKIKQIEKQLHVNGVKVDSICFNTQNSQRKMELLLMEDEFFGQIIETA